MVKRLPGAVKPQYSSSASLPPTGMGTKLGLKVVPVGMKGGWADLRSVGEGLREAGLLEEHKYARWSPGVGGGREHAIPIFQLFSIKKINCIFKKWLVQA